MLDRGRRRKISRLDGHGPNMGVRVRVCVRFDGPRTEGPANTISWKLIDEKPTEAGHGEPLPQINDNQVEISPSSPGTDIPRDDEDEDDLLDMGSKGGQHSRNQWGKKSMSYRIFWAVSSTKSSFVTVVCCKHSNVKGQAYYGWRKRV